MILKNSKNSYGILSVLNHWVGALLCLVLFAMGFYMVTLTYYDPLYHQLPTWHKYLGIWLILLSGIRFILNRFQPKPTPTSHHSWEKILARLVHRILMILIWVCLASGYLIIANESINWLGLELPTFNLPMERQADTAGLWHKIATYVLMGLVLLHTSAVLKHHFWDKTNTLKKMFSIKIK